MTRVEAGSSDPVLLVHSDGTRQSIQSRTSVAEWLPAWWQGGRRRKVLQCLDYLTGWYEIESTKRYRRLSEPLLRELEAPVSLRRDKENPDRDIGEVGPSANPTDADPEFARASEAMTSLDSDEVQGVEGSEKQKYRSRRGSSE